MAGSKTNNMGLFSALSGKIYRFNSINTPIDNDIFARIKKLNESFETVYILCAFSITQKMIFLMFHPDNGIFKKSLDVLTKENLEKIYYILLDLCLWRRMKSPMSNINSEKLISSFAKISRSTINKKKEDIEVYIKADAAVFKANEDICIALNKQKDAQSAISFSSSFLDSYNELVEIE